jgi:hypothetical protein
MIPTRCRSTTRTLARKRCRKRQIHCRILQVRKTTNASTRPTSPRQWWDKFEPQLEVYLRNELKRQSEPRVNVAVDGKWRMQLLKLARQEDRNKPISSKQRKHVAPELISEPAHFFSAYATWRSALPLWSRAKIENRFRDCRAGKLVANGR